jgi:hypothetical protein
LFLLIVIDYGLRGSPRIISSPLLQIAIEGGARDIELFTDIPHRHGDILMGPVANIS